MQRIDTYTVELRMETVALAHEMVRLERWAKEAAKDGRWQHVAEYLLSRERARERRSQLLRELWESQR